MATRNALNARAARKTIDPCTPCPVCGGLECFCRPRFYAGQLLNEQDLNRLDRYIVGKSRLHNRYLHGWGVACGLEVSCHPCGNYALVMPGYALSPCGDDIVVCHEETVDVCKLIADCCAPAEDECGKPRTRPDGCDEATQEWILAICYHEAPSREEPAIKSSCGPRCSCGGSSAGGCGCGGAKGGCGCGGGTHKSGGCGCSTKDTAARPRSRASVSCEPAMVCEGYTFRVYPAPKRQEETPRGLGAMLERMLACMRQLAASIPPLPSGAQNVEAIRRWCCDTRDALLDAMADHAITNCELLAALRNTCPLPGPNQTAAEYLQQVTTELRTILIALLRDCICSALLPPCPGPALDACVPLAALTIRRKDCRILRVCNLEARKFLVTFPNLAYWLSFLPFGALLRQVLARICCAERRVDSRPVTPGRPIFAARASAFERPPAHVFTAFASAFGTARPVPTLDALSFDMLGLADENRQPFLSADQADDPISRLLAEEVIAPLFGSAVPAGGAAALGDVPTFDAARFAGEVQRRDKEMTGLRGQLDELQKIVRTQQVTIEGLINRISRDE